MGSDGNETDGFKRCEPGTEEQHIASDQKLPDVFCVRDNGRAIFLMLPPRESLSRRRFLRNVAIVAAASPLCETVLSRAAASPPTYTFEEVLPSKSGIRWVHNAGKSAQKFLPESSGAGCAFLDFDNDGWMDIYLVNSGKANFYNPPHLLQNALYRNNRDGTFTDVTAKAGAAGGGYGMGVAVGDYNGDGYPDIYVTQCGRNIL